MEMQTRNEVTVTEPQIIMNPVKPGVIQIKNLDELKAQLRGYLEQYQGAQYTEETKAFAKATLADLRKLKKATNDVNVAAKKEYMKPCDEFEVQVKELMALIDEPINLIDRQVKEFEAKRVKERAELIRKIYDETVGSSEYAEYAPLQKIYSGKWENASTSEKAIREAMSEELEGVTMEVESIRVMLDDPEAQAYALRQYKAGCTVVEAVKRAKEYLDMLVRKAAREKAEREEAARREAERKAAEAFLAAEPAEEEETEEAEEDEGTQTPFWQDMATATYTVHAPAVKLEMLESYMIGNGIAFERRRS